MTDETDLHIQTNVVGRSGDVVLRRAGPHSRTVHSLLRYLEKAGFDGAPRVVGSGFDAAGRETLRYVEGEIVHPCQRGAEAAFALGRLIRIVHDSTASYAPPAHAVWRPSYIRDLGESRRVIGHCDAAPWNVVLRDGIPVALIDWDLAGPVDPLFDLALAAWLNAGLYGDEIPEAASLPSVGERARMLRAIADGYGLASDDRRRLVGTILECAMHATAAAADEFGVTRETTHSPALWAMAWQSRSMAWILRHRVPLEAALE